MRKRRWTQSKEVYFLGVWHYKKSLSSEDINQVSFTAVTLESQEVKGMSKSMSGDALSSVGDD